MLNLEGLKNINSLLSQIIEILESESTPGEWLNFLTHAAKKLGNSSSNPFSSLLAREEPLTEQENNKTPASSANFKPEMDITNLWKILVPINKLAKQLKAMGPVLNTLTKNLTEIGQPATSRYTVNPIPHSRPNIYRPNWGLMAALLPVLLLYFLEFRY